MMDEVSFDHLFSMLRMGESSYYADFKEWPLTSAFQPIYSIDHQKIVGHEALVRSPKGSPADIFGRATNGRDFILLDRLCRVLHIFNYIRANVTEGWLFLNLNYQVIRSSEQFGSFLTPLFKQAQIHPSRIVIEILEEKITDEELLMYGVSYYKQLGCLVAIDDFGAGHANFDRIWKVNPHIVKLDRSIISHAVTRPSVRNMLPNLVSLIHEAGSLTLVEGVETEEQVLIAMDANVDFLQGFYFSKPALFIAHETEATKARFSALHRQFRTQHEHLEHRRQALLVPYLEAFQASYHQLKQGGNLAESCQALLDLPGILSCYLLNASGMSVNFLLHPSYHQSRQKDPRFAALARTQPANWYRAPHYRNATKYQEQLQISAPYLSLNHCQVIITLSIAFTLQETTYTLCCDLDLIDEWLKRH